MTDDLEAKWRRAVSEIQKLRSNDCPAWKAVREFSDALRFGSKEYSRCRDEWQRLESKGARKLGEAEFYAASALSEIGIKLGFKEKPE